MLGGRIEQAILEVFDMAKSSYCYQQKKIKRENKIVKIKERIKILFLKTTKDMDTAAFICF